MLAEHFLVLIQRVHPGVSIRWLPHADGALGHVLCVFDYDGDDHHLPLHRDEFGSDSLWILARSVYASFCGCVYAGRDV